MNVSKFTEKSKDVITSASNITVSNNNSEITEYHMLLGLTETNESLITMLLKKMDVDVESLKITIQEEIEKLPKPTGAVALRFSQTVEKALDNAEKEANSMKDEFISVEHLMLGVINSASENLKKIFKVYNIDKHKFLSALKDIRGNKSEENENDDGNSDILQILQSKTN